MTYQITLTPDEYAALSAAAARKGRTVEALVHAALAELYPLPTGPQPRLTQREFLEQLYREGVISNIPTGEPDTPPDTPEEEAERERLANSIQPGKPLSEIVIEDRGLQ
jgi:hypothetical protein